MSEKKTNEENLHFGFRKENYKLLLIGLAINVIGFLLMIGGGSDDPDIFKADELFSRTRLTVSPILIISGYVVIIFAIMRKNKSQEQITEE